jgi:hypothetical protein
VGNDGRGGQAVENQGATKPVKAEGKNGCGKRVLVVSASAEKQASADMVEGLGDIKLKFCGM